MSDTPRTDAHNWNEGDYDDPLDSMADFAMQLERELKAANERIELLTACNADVARIAKERDDALERIKRLDGHIERLESIGDSLFDGVTRIEAEQRWRKAKEAKP